jgi:hypothetical protein
MFDIASLLAIAERSSLSTADSRLLATNVSALMLA